MLSRGTRFILFVFLLLALAFTQPSGFYDFVSLSAEPRVRAVVSAPLDGPAPSPLSRESVYSTLYSCGVAGGRACGGLNTSRQLVEAVYETFEAAAERPECETLITSPEHWTVEWPARLLAGDDGDVCVALGTPHNILLHARNATGAALCRGGDYVEALLEGSGVRSRLRTTDWGNGTYVLELLLPDDELLLGPASVSARVAFRAFGGLARHLDYERESFVDKWALPPTRVTLVRAATGCTPGGVVAAAPSRPPRLLLPPSRVCTTVDFMAVPFWEGHWVAQPRDAAACAPGACAGSPRGILSADWVYRLRSCFFQLFSPPQARACVNGSWLFSSGDSNFLDTAGNLLHLVLALNTSNVLKEHDFHHQPSGRSFDIRGFYGSAPGGWPPAAVDDAHALDFRVSNIWNPAPAENGPIADQCCFGISVIATGAWRGRHEALLRHEGFAGAGPDVMLINSGLHDGMRYSLVKEAFADFASDLQLLALPWWDRLRAWATGVEPEKEWVTTDGERAACSPRMIWRSTVAPAGIARKKRANPQHVELLNRLVGGALLERGGEAALARAEAVERGGDAAPRPRARPRDCASGRPLVTGGAAWSFVDAFDMTYAWHMDNSFSDGGHYGRKICGRMGECDHVDRMMIHVLLNGFCPTETE